MAVTAAADAHAPRAKRMKRRDRRRQLLDVAASLLVNEGTRGVTMERVAECAGVSKALPYSHFANAEELLVAVYQRSSTRLGRVVWTALEEASRDGSADLASVWVSAHFRHGAGQGDVFGALITPGSAIPSMADRDSEGERFVGKLLHRYFDIEVEHARSVAGLVLGAFVGSSNAWLREPARREAIERSMVEMIRGVVSTARSTTADGHEDSATT